MLTFDPPTNMPRQTSRHGPPISPASWAKMVYDAGIPTSEEELAGLGPYPSDQPRVYPVLRHIQHVAKLGLCKPRPASKPWMSGSTMNAVEFLYVRPIWSQDWEDKSTKAQRYGYTKSMLHDHGFITDCSYRTALNKLGLKSSSKHGDYNLGPRKVNEATLDDSQPFWTRDAPSSAYATPTRPTQQPAQVPGAPKAKAPAPRTGDRFLTQDWTECVCPSFHTLVDMLSVTTRTAVQQRCESLGVFAETWSAFTSMNRLDQEALEEVDKFDKHNDAMQKTPSRSNDTRPLTLALEALALDPDLPTLTPEAAPAPFLSDATDTEPDRMNLKEPKHPDETTVTMFLSSLFNALARIVSSRRQSAHKMELDRDDFAAYPREGNRRRPNNAEEVPNMDEVQWYYNARVDASVESLVSLLSLPSHLRILCRS